MRKFTKTIAIMCDFTTLINTLSFVLSLCTKHQNVGNPLLSTKHMHAFQIHVIYHLFLIGEVLLASVKYRSTVAIRTSAKFFTLRMQMSGPNDLRA